MEECNNCHICITTDSTSTFCSTNHYVSSKEGFSQSTPVEVSDNSNNNNDGNMEKENGSNLITCSENGNAGYKHINKYQTFKSSRENIRKSVTINLSRIPILKQSSKNNSTHRKSRALNLIENNLSEGQGSSGDADHGGREPRIARVTNNYCQTVGNSKTVINDVYLNDCRKEEIYEEKITKNKHRYQRHIFTMNKPKVVKSNSLDDLKASECSDKSFVTNHTYETINLNVPFNNNSICRKTRSEFDYEKLLENIRKTRTSDKITTLFSFFTGIERNSLVGQTFISEIQILFSREEGQDIYRVVDAEEMGILLPNYSVDIISSKLYKIDKHDSSNIISHYVDEIKKLIAEVNVDKIPIIGTFLANIFCTHQEAQVRFLNVSRSDYQLWIANKQIIQNRVDRNSVMSTKEILIQLCHIKEVLFQSELNLKSVIEKYIETQRENDREEMIKVVCAHGKMTESALKATDDFSTQILKQKVEELIRNLGESQNTVSSLLVKNEQLAMENEDLMDRMQYGTDVGYTNAFNGNETIKHTDNNERLKQRFVLVQNRCQRIKHKLEKSEEHNAILLDRLLQLRSQMDSEKRLAQSAQADLNLEIACIRRINTGRETALRQAIADGDGLLNDISRIEQCILKAGKKIQLLSPEIVISCGPGRSFTDFVATCRSCIKILSQELVTSLEAISNLQSQLDKVTVDYKYANQEIKDLLEETVRLKDELSKLEQLNIHNVNNDSLWDNSGMNDTLGGINLIYAAQEFIPKRDCMKIEETNKQEACGQLCLQETNEDLKEKLSIVEKRCEELTMELRVINKEKESLSLALQESDLKVKSSEKLIRELQSEKEHLLVKNQSLTEKLVEAMNLLSYSKSVVENLNKKKTALECSFTKPSDNSK